MSTAELCLTYRPEDEWHGELNATVRSGAFSGQSSAWFDRTNLKKTFVAALRAYPLTPTALPMIEGGIWSKDNRGSLDQCHLRVAVTPSDSRGTLLVRADLATQSWRPLETDQQHSVTARFLTDYVAVAEFADELDRVLDGVQEQALIKSTQT
jgi:hypothetical protein